MASGGVALTPRALAIRLFRAALDSVNADRAVRNAVALRNATELHVNETLVADLARFRDVLVVGAGKSSTEMAVSLTNVLRANPGVLDKVRGGLIITKTHHASPEAISSLKRSRIEVREAQHPLPDVAGRDATLELMNLLRRYDSPDTFVFYLASGGGSALTSAVGERDYLDPDAMRRVIRYLLFAGIPIEEVNAVRKHVCAFHGGKVPSRIAPRSFFCTLAVSDVVGDSLSIIAGGPTTPDTSTLEDCRKILTSISDKTGEMPSELRRAFFGGEGDAVGETPKPLAEFSSYPSTTTPTRNCGFIVASNSIALRAMERTVHDVYPWITSVEVLSTRLEGEAKEVGKLVATIALERASRDPAEDFCLLFGGETTVTIPEGCEGVGGRNQELGLVCAVELASANVITSPLVVLSAGTDGTDGPMENAPAGVVVSFDSVKPTREGKDRARRALENHDAYNYFAREAPECLIQTGATGTNVMDVIAVLYVPSLPRRQTADL